MFGAIVGDVAGSRFEFDRGGKTKNFEFITDECEYTDDTVMTLAVAEALMNAGIDADEKTVKKGLVTSMQKWGSWYPNSGYGSSFIHWLHSSKPEPYGSYGNGSAMRVSAAGWLYETLERTLEVAGWTAEVSHNHPEGIKGAKCTAAVIFLARTGHSKKEIERYVIENFDYDFSESLDEMRKRHSHVETCMDSLPKALRSFFDGDSYEDVVRNAVSLGGDTDTLAAIAGAMAEAYYGGAYVYEESVRIGRKMWEVIKRFKKLTADKKPSPEIMELRRMDSVHDDEKLFDWAYSHDHGNQSVEVFEKAVEIYKYFIEKGDGMAMNNLASMYYNGCYFEKDLKMSEKYYEMACEKGVSLAYGNLACVYYYGDDSIRDYLKCYDWLMRGAVLFDNTECYMRLGDLFRYGKGVDKNEDLAFRMYVKALNCLPKDSETADPNLGGIRKRIGECFLYGIGVQKDAHEALFNFSVAMTVLYAMIDDNDVMSSIRQLKEELKEAQDILEGNLRENKLSLCS